MNETEETARQLWQLWQVCIFQMWKLIKIKCYLFWMYIYNSPLILIFAPRGKEIFRKNITKLIVISLEHRDRDASFAIIMYNEWVPFVGFFVLTIAFVDVFFFIVWHLTLFHTYVRYIHIGTKNDYIYINKKFCVWTCQYMYV